MCVGAKGGSGCLLGAVGVGGGDGWLRARAWGRVLVQARFLAHARGGGRGEELGGPGANRELGLPSAGASCPRRGGRLWRCGRKGGRLVPSWVRAPRRHERRRQQTQPAWARLAWAAPRACQRRRRARIGLRAGVDRVEHGSSRRAPADCVRAHPSSFRHVILRAAAGGGVLRHHADATRAQAAAHRHGLRRVCQTHACRVDLGRGAAAPRRPGQSPSWHTPAVHYPHHSWRAVRRLPYTGLATAQALRARTPPQRRCGCRATGPGWRPHQTPHLPVTHPAIESPPASALAHRSGRSGIAGCRCGRARQSRMRACTGAPGCHRRASPLCLATSSSASMPK